MIPLRDENPTIHASLVTMGIIAANAFTWIFIQKMGTYPGLIESICRYGLIPGELLGTVEPGTPVLLGGGVHCYTGAPAWWTVFTSMFMHGGWLHVIGNLWFLWIFGDNVEDAMGSAKFLVFYLLCGLAAAALQVFFSPRSVVPMVGASGAIGGVMGAYAVLYPRAPVHMLVFFGFFVFRVVVPAFLMLGYWFLLQFLGGFMTLGMHGGGVAFWAHVGGFLGGVFLVRIFADPGRVAEIRARRGKTYRIITRHYPRGW